jgi:ribosomal protein L29
MKTKTTKANPTLGSLSDLKTKIMEIRLSIKAHQEKNTNAHKAVRKQIAQLLTKRDTVSL